MERTMPRNSRIVFPGVPLHIIQRGNNRQVCFSGDTDRQVYLALLGAHAQDSGCDLHAYVLMSNHVHLLLTPHRAESAARLMKALGERYVQYYNRRHGRTGSLWEGRFRSCLVQDERYLLVCQRYIELNPVRADMAKLPGEYLWSSYAANALGVRNSLLRPHATYGALGHSDVERQQNYRALFMDVLGPTVLKHLRSAVNGNFSFGDKQFEQRMRCAAGRSVTPGSAGRPHAAVPKRRPASVK
jgi:putative transposase